MDDAGIGVSVEVEEVAAGISELVEASGCRGSEVEVMLGKKKRGGEKRGGKGRRE